MELNENQTRALWAVALHQLADMINGGVTNPPTSADLWTQWVDLEDLLSIADSTYVEPLPIKVTASVATVRVPAGAKLGIQISWIFQTKMPNDKKERDRTTRLIHIHNSECVNTSDTPPAGILPVEDVTA